MTHVVGSQDERHRTSHSASRYVLAGLPLLVVSVALLIGWSDTRRAAPLTRQPAVVVVSAKTAPRTIMTRRQITRATVAETRQLFRVALPGVADGIPAYLANVSTSSGSRDLVFVTTKDGHIVALDAHTGAQIWSHQNPAGSCKINNGSYTCYTTASPVVDPNHRYVYSYGLDGYVHRYAVGSGTEVTGHGWPELATRKPFDEKGSSNLQIATAHNGTTYLYVANGGYPGDNGDYQGHVTTINLATGTQHVFNTNCSNQAVHFREKPSQPDCPAVQTAVWSRVPVVYDSATDKLYLATGNGDYRPSADDWGDSVLKINPDGTGLHGGPLDSYTPTNYQSLADTDTDLGSTSPVLLPVPARGALKHLAVQVGKDGLLRLLNLDNLSGQGGPGHVGGEVATPLAMPQGGGVLTIPTVWVNPQDHSTWFFVANGNGISGLRLTFDITGHPHLQTMWQTSNGGSSPVLAANMIFYAGGNIIRALNPATGATLWSNTGIGGIHWESPRVAGGILYITDESGYLTAFD